MNLLPRTIPKTLNLLSIGQRAVGKTVFLAGSYAELHSNSLSDRSQRLWFDCQDSEGQEKIERLLSYMTETGQYPPPTIKITDFNFSLKYHNKRGIQTLCQFNWWDIPGEVCNVNSADFRRMVSNSHGCCVFIDAFKLINDRSYLELLKGSVILQVKALADLVGLNGLKYAFSLVLTKCDLFESAALNQRQVRERLQLLTTHLDIVKANYQIFYSSVPIVRTEGGLTIEPTGAAAPLLWLAWELNQAHNPGLVNGPLNLVTHLLPSYQRSGHNTVSGLRQNLRGTSSGTFGIRKGLDSLELRLRSLPTVHRYYLIAFLVLIGSVGIIGALFIDYNRVYSWVNQLRPNNDALSQMEPKNLGLRLQIAQSYERMGQNTAAETLYDEILTEQQNNLDALVGKAVIRHDQGDPKMAKALFEQAESAAPADLKAQIRDIAQKTLQAPPKQSVQ